MRHDMASAIHHFKIISPGTGFRTGQWQNCVFARYGFPYWEPVRFSVPGPPDFRHSPWYGIPYYFLYFHL